MDTAWVQKVLGREEYKEVVNGHTTTTQGVQSIRVFRLAVVCDADADVLHASRVVLRAAHREADSLEQRPMGLQGSQYLRQWQAETVARTRLIEDNEWYTPQKPATDH